MKLILSILLTGILALIAGMFLPWWSIALVAFLVAIVMDMRPGTSFLSGFAAIFLLWGIIALWIDIRNESILSHKIAQLFPLGGSSIFMILITALVGALVGGFAALSGSSLRPARYRRRF